MCAAPSYRGCRALSFCSLSRAASRMGLYGLYRPFGQFGQIGSFGVVRRVRQVGILGWSSRVCKVCKVRRVGKVGRRGGFFCDFGAGICRSGTNYIIWQRYSLLTFSSYRLCPPEK